MYRKRIGNYVLIVVCIAKELCESRGGPSLISLTVSVDTEMKRQLGQGGTHSKYRLEDRQIIGF